MVLLVPFNLHAQKSKTAQILYQNFSHGEPQEKAGTIIITHKDGIARLETQYPFERNEMLSRVSEFKWQDYKTNKSFQSAKIDGKSYYSESTIEVPEGAVVSDSDVKILGMKCKKMTFTSFSNKIELWYTKDARMQGSPSYTIPGALVLKVLRNGSREIRAVDIEKIGRRDAAKLSLVPSEKGQLTDSRNLRYLIQQGAVTTVKVFEDDQICFGNKKENPAPDTANQLFQFAGGTVIMKKISLPEHDVDCDVFLELKQKSNGDAYDRTGSVFMIRDTDGPSMLDAFRNGIKTVPSFKDQNGKQYFGMVRNETFEPAIELMRFFTPFGVNAYNERVKLDGMEWADQTYYKQSISYLEPIMKGDVWIGVFIGNYDKGGHKVSLDIKYYPKGSKKRSEEKKYWVQSVFNTCNIMEMAGQGYPTMFGFGGLQAPVNVPEGVENIKLHYITTGHGGWGGGDEFNPKENEILIDGAHVYAYTPWRCDCATYRELNPASGNFYNGESSSDLDRSGWCPGTVTNPVQKPLPGLTAGQHTMEVQIPQGQNAGSSFSSWCVSGILIGEYTE